MIVKFEDFPTVCRLFCFCSVVFSKLLCITELLVIGLVILIKLKPEILISSYAPAKRAFKCKKSLIR